MTLSFAEIDSQHVELLPARTVMSLFTLGDPGINGSGGDGGDGKGGPVACAVSIGDLTAALGLILGSGSAEGSGSSCNSTGTGGAGGTGVFGGK
ncbi:MAG TPA: hypothetical protein VHH53_13880 [Pseudonocardiaceae bacterium]|jgi:hypothetical protein|nr:hypothetical protein [Pseudonocardiaceae bacterium]